MADFWQGETLAHILNGALNRQMRDALLLHQAISESAPGKERTELLISRLVRMQVPCTSGTFHS